MGPRTTKLHGCPIQKFDANILKLVYTICSRNLMNKDFHEIYPLNDGKFIRCEESKPICKKKIISESKTAATHKYQGFTN